MAFEARHAVLTAITCAGLVGLVIAWSVDPMPTEPIVPAQAGRGPGVAAASPRSETKTRRAAADELGRRHGVRIVIDAAVRADDPAPAVPGGDLDTARLESTLRELLAGNELLFHYGVDRLETLWVFARVEDFAVRATAGDGVSGAGEAAGSRQQVAALHEVPRMQPTSVPDTPSLGLRDPDENVRLQALQVETDGSPAPLHDLRQLVDADPSEAVRIRALEALVTHPDATDGEISAALERMSNSPLQLLADHARILRDARAAAAEGPELTPEPIDEKP